MECVALPGSALEPAPSRLAARARRLNRAVELMALVFAGFQAFAFVTMLSTSPTGGLLNGGAGAAEIAGVSLVAAVGVLVLLTRAVSRLGLVNGIVGLSIVFSLSRVVEQLLASPNAFAAVSGALVVAATWIALKGSESSFAAATLTEFARKADSGESERLWVSVPASSVQPVVVVPALLAFPFTLQAFQGSGAEQLAVLATPPLRLPVSLGLAAAFVLVLSFLLQDPRASARTLYQLRGGVSHAGESGLARRFRSTIGGSFVPTLLFISCLILANELVPASLANASLFALLTALGLDVAVAARARARNADLVCIREERRPHLVPFLVAALARHGLDARVLGLHQTSLARFFAPYLSVELCVPAADAERAREVMRHVFEAPTSEAALLEEDPNPLPPDVRGATWAARSRNKLLAALSAGALALVLLAPPPELPVAATLPVVSVEVLLVEDGIRSLRRPRSGSLACGRRGARGKGRARSTRDRAGAPCANRAPARESLTEALVRLDPWINELTLPPGAKLAFADVKEADEASARSNVVAWRSYLVQGSRLLGAGDVEGAEVGSDQETAYVTLRLRPSATERFRRATGENIGRRMAIIVDGKVRSTPVLQSEIPGPNLRITMGNSRPEAALAEASELLAALTGQSSPAPSR